MASPLVFQAAIGLILLGWLLLLAALLLPVSRTTRSRLLNLGGIVVPLLVSLAYAVALATALDRADGSLFSLEGIVARFADPDRLFLLYLEAMAFSLFIGRWIALDGIERSVARPIVIVMLLLQAALGPPALAAWLLARGSKLGIRKRPFRKKGIF